MTPQLECNAHRILSQNPVYSMGAGASTALENAVAPKRMSKARAKQKRKQNFAKASVEAESSAHTLMKKYGRSQPEVRLPRTLGVCQE